MTGPARRPAPRRDRTIQAPTSCLHYTDGTRLSFADVRTFGRMRLVEAGRAVGRAIWALSRSPPGFTQEAFIGMLAGRTTPIKALLLDQRRIAGIGNIYACEALWEARIRPSRPAKALTKPATRRLYHADRGRFGPRDRNARNERRRLRGCRRPPRRISKRPLGLRQARRALLAVRQTDRTNGAGATRNLVVPKLSALTFAKI